MTLMDPWLALALLVFYGVMIFAFTRKDSFFVWPAVALILVLLTIWEFKDWVCRKLWRK